MQEALLLLSSFSHTYLLRPVSTEIKDKFRYFSRLVLDVWVLDDHLDIFSDNHHVNHEQEANEESREYFYIAFAQLYHLLSMDWA